MRRIRVRTVRLAAGPRPAPQCIARHTLRVLAPSQTRSQPMNTRMIAILALVIAAIVLVIILV